MLCRLVFHTPFAKYNPSFITFAVSYPSEEYVLDQGFSKKSLVVTKKLFKNFHLND